MSNSYELHNGTKPSNQTRASQACERARMKVVRSLGVIIDSHIKEAKDGSYQHAKFLFDWAGVSPEAMPAGEYGANDLARLLLETLDQQAEAVAAAELAKSEGALK